MGRSLTAVSTDKKVWENEGYEVAPIWEFLSLNTSNTWRSTYGANDDINLLDLTQVGSLAGTRTRGWLRGSDEVTNTGWYLNNSTTTNGVTTNSWSPQSGFWGITNFTDTGTCAHWYSSVREYGYISGDDSANVLRYSTPVILPSTENQNFEFITLDRRVQLFPIGATWGVHVSRTNSEGVDLSALTGFTPSAGEQPTNFGMACYNARSGVYAVAYRTGTTGANYRIHLFPIGKDIRQFTTHAQLRAAFQTAMSGYKFVDVSLTGVANTNTQSDRYQHKLVMCDDNTLWITVNDTANTTSGNQGLRTYRIVSDVFSLSGVQTLTQYAQVGGSAAHYGLNSGIYYATRHMMSYDNSVMAVYTHYHHYLAGAIGRFLPTGSVNNEVIGCRGFQYTNTTYGFGIAPAGGSAFMFSAGYSRNGAQNYVWKEDPVMLISSQTALATAIRNVQGAYVQHGSDAIYQSHVVNKILQLDRFK